MTGKRAGMAQSRTAGSPLTESSLDQESGGIRITLDVFPGTTGLLHTGCLFLPFISVHLPLLLLLLLCSSLSRRLPLRQHDFRSGPDRCRISGSRACRTTLPESVHTQFPRSVLNLFGVVYRWSQRAENISRLCKRGVGQEMLSNTLQWKICTAL